MKCAKKTSYGSMSVEDVQRKFNITFNLQTIFEPLPVVAPSDILKSALRRASGLALFSEKSRSEFIVAPILLEVRELAQEIISIYSGVTFDVSPEEGLQGICDFLITQSPPLPTIQAPIIMLVEAKKNDIETGLGQCAAEMIAAQRVNQRNNYEQPYIYGCVTSGELWQFLRLKNTRLDIDSEKLYIEHLDRILGFFLKIIKG
ncbi:conserved hypothetical protein [Gammaproteobacteria bacterium]